MDDDNERAERARRGNPFLNTAQVAHYIGLHPLTLERMRAKGKGPPFRRHGYFIRYHIDDVDQWSRTNGQQKLPRPERGSNV